AELGHPLELDVPDLESAESPLGTATNHLGFHKQLTELAANAPVVKSADARVSELEWQRGKAVLAMASAEIRAPVAGTVARRAVQPGSQVEPGQTLLVIEPATATAMKKPAVESVGKTREIEK